MSSSVLGQFYKLDGRLFEFNLKVLYLVGAWPRDDLTKNQHIIYKIYEFVLHLLTIVLFIVTDIGIYKIKNDFTLLLSNLAKILLAYNFAFKGTVFIINRDKLKDLIEDIENSGDIITREKKKLSANTLLIVTIMSFLIVGAFSGLAIFKGEMTIEAWMPFDPLKNFLNLVISALIISIIFLPGLLRAFAIQGLVCSLTLYLCDQLIELQNTLRELKYTRITEHETRRELKAITQKHIRLIEYANTMEMIFRAYFLIQNTAIAVELCLNAIMITVVSDTTVVLTFLACLGLVLSNAYIYSYLGNELIVQSEGLATAGYESQWTSWPIDMQKELLTLITVAQKPLALTAGGLSFVSRVAYGQALYNGYSIFAVLNDMVQ